MKYSDLYFWPQCIAQNIDISQKRGKISGFCDPKYARIKKQLEEMVRAGYDENVQLCVYVEGAIHK